MSVLATFVSADVIGSSGRHWRALRGFKLAMGDRLHGGRTASQPGRQAVGRERENDGIRRLRFPLPRHVQQLATLNGQTTNYTAVIYAAKLTLVIATGICTVLVTETSCGLDGLSETDTSGFSDDLR